MVDTSTTDATSSPAAVVGSEEEAGYRTVSILAIVSLVLGIASPLSLIAPLLYAIPIAGAAVALLAMRRIAASDGMLVGRAAAAIGLALSIASITAAYTRTTLSQELLSRQARVAAIDWIRLLQSGDVEQAFELMPPDVRQPPPPMPGEPAAEPVSPMEAFRSNPVVKLLLNRKSDLNVQYVRDTGFDPSTGGRTRIQQLFTAGPSAAADQTPPESIEIVMLRSPGFGGRATRWLVSAYRIDDGASSN